MRGGWKDKNQSRESGRKVDIMTKVKNFYGVEINFDAAVNIMDDEIREQIHADMAPCAEQDFF